MQKRRRDCVIFVVLLCLITLTQSATVRRAIPVGVILDSNSSLGDMVSRCINIGLHDFNSRHDSYATNLQLHFMDYSTNDLLTAADAARDLITKEKVHAILGPQNSEDARFVVELGNKSNIPVIWFSSTGPSLLPPRSRFFIDSNSIVSHCSQFNAIAAIIEAYGWQCVIPIYEEPEFGNDLIPCLTYALQDMDTRVPYTSPIRQDSSEDCINKELRKIKGNRTCVVLAHMTVELWSKLAEQAHDKGMMSEGYAWILTQGLSSVMDPEAKDKKVKVYMEGALGVRPSLVVSPSKVVSTITRRKRIFLAKTLKSQYNKKLSLYGMWAYDTITALANAVENAGLVSSTVKYTNGNRVDVTNIGGQKLRQAIQNISFAGLSGNFSLRKGQLEPSIFVVYNVKDQRERLIGYWRPETGIIQNYSVVGELAGKYKLRDPIWPGDTTERPPKLKVGVPKAHFTEFVNVTREVKNVLATGFAVDVFKRVVDVLPFPLSYDFVPVNNILEEPNRSSSYEDLLCNITNKNVDLIIGDITILVNRTNCVDFTMPYLDSSVSMVKVRSDSKNRWILLKPFDRKLWLILGVIFVGATVYVIILEKRKKYSEFKCFVQDPFLIYVSDVKLFESVTSTWVVIVVMFLLTIAVQVYTANLTSILSERTKAKPSQWKDLQQIKRNNDVKVGYQNGSWVKELLTNQIGLKEDKLKALTSPEDYKNELSKEGVAAIFDETPYIMLLLSKCPDCKMTGPIYKTGGFAFAFPKNSAMVSFFSAGILKVTQNVKMFRDMKKNTCLPVTVDKTEYRSNVETRNLTKDDFGGLFPIVYSVLALFFTISILKLPFITRWLENKLASFWTVSGGGVIFICSLLNICKHITYV